MSTNFDQTIHNNEVQHLRADVSENCESEQIASCNERPQNDIILESSINTPEYNDNKEKQNSIVLPEPELANVIKDPDQEVKVKIIPITEPEKPKILVQRVFHKFENHVVEPKLDIVVANSESEITKHVFGGLFNTKYYPYIPENYCKKHKAGLFEFGDVTLPKIGDKFESLESFRLYVDSKAKQWKYYLKCADSHRKNGKDTFVYQCVFAKPRSYVSKAKGLRKRTRKVPLHDCPCRVLVKPVPFGAKDLTVIYVCNHHDHPLTDEYFCKLQHGRRFHPSVKEELMDILSLDVEREVVTKYFELLTGYNMNYGFFSNVLTYMRKNKIKRELSVEKLTEMLNKIEYIKKLLLHENEDNSKANSKVLGESVHRDTTGKIVEVFNILNTVSAPKKTPWKRKKYSADVVETSVESKGNESRLLRRLRQLNDDEETLRNVKDLQVSVTIDRNPWVGQSQKHIHSRKSSAQKKEQEKNIDHGNNEIVTEQIIETVEQSLGEVYETSHCDNEIYYENEITVLETGEHEHDSEYVVYENPEYALSETIGDDVSYCIEYENDETANEQMNEFILLDKLERMPVQIKATELATINIIPENVNSDMSNINEVSVNNVNNNADAEQKPSVLQPKVDSNIEFIRGECDAAINLNHDDVYEIIETDNKKILPNRKFVHKVLFNKEEDDKKSKKNPRPKPKNNTKGVLKKRNKKPKFYNTPHVCEVEKLCNNIQVKNETNLDVDDDLDDSDHYIIVVDNNENSDRNTSSCDENDLQEISFFNSNSEEVQRVKIENDIQKLKRLKSKLKRDVRMLRDIKNGLLKDISLAKEITM